MEKPFLVELSFFNNKKLLIYVTFCVSRVWYFNFSQIISVGSTNQSSIRKATVGLVMTTLEEFLVHEGQLLIF